MNSCNVLINNKSRPVIQLRVEVFGTAVLIGDTETTDKEMLKTNGEK